MVSLLHRSAAACQCNTVRRLTDQSTNGSVPLCDAECPPPNRIEQPGRSVIVLASVIRTPALICLLTALAATASLAACGSGQESPIEVKVKDDDTVKPVLGFPLLATKNTTRVPGKDPVQNAAAVASAVFTGGAGRQRPPAVTLVSEKRTAAAIAAAVLMSRPLRAPILLTDGGDIPDETKDTIKALRPTGSLLANGVEVFRVGDAGVPGALSSARIGGADDFELAAAIDAFAARTSGHRSRSVIVTSADDPRYAMPAAAWAAKAGDPVLFVRRDALPPATRRAIVRHRRPSIYVLGPASVISDAVVRRLRQLGSVTRIAGSTPVASAIAFARFSNGAFGWGIRDPGHGLVIANWHRPLDAPAAAALSASGTYGPLLLTDTADRLPQSLLSFLLDIEPGYQNDPVRGVYNHAWLIGDESAISLAMQAKIDEVTEIARVSEEPGP
jgi:hypothetical protein